jgi:zinc protease
VPTASTDMETLERKMLEEIERLKNDPIDESELQRVQARVIASEIFRRDSIQSQAFELGMLQTIGLGWQVSDEYVDRIREVTADDVQRVVREYLVPERRTVGVLEPLPIGSEA